MDSSSGHFCLQHCLWIWMDWCMLALWPRGTFSPSFLKRMAPQRKLLNLIQIAPLKLRHAGAAAGAFGEWLFSFITVFAGGIALRNVGWKIWLWMALSCAAAVP